MENKIRVGTLFSGIGAFEEALKQLEISHEISFACDNGEIELIPLSSGERREFKDFEKRVRRLNDEEKIRHKELKDKIAKINEEVRAKCYAMPDKASRTNYVNELYRQYEGEHTNWVKVSYLANNHIAEDDFHTDVRFMRGDDYLGKVDILVGGSPCQSFSTYGKKQGLEDARGTLFYDYARIIKESQPKVFIYENVASILTNDSKMTWRTMLSVWESLGYEIVWSILNSADYNHPQLRKRLFLIGFRKDIYKVPYTFPEKMELTHKSTEYLEKGPVDDIYYLGQKGFEWITTPEKNLRRSRVNQDIIGCQTANQQDNWIGDFRVEHPQPHHYNHDRIYIGKYDFNDGKGPVDAVGRKMTPRECLNLMGFSDKFKIVVDDRIAYRQAGNSIVVPVLKEIMKSLKPYL
jgi:DNA (cytosine-5)-methyltransferase 1